MERLKDKYRRFKEWQLQPYQVAPISEEEHKCATCGTSYQGNYCPRCGQSAKIGRYSFKNAFKLFLDVWGIGNRGMFRTCRDLILRPGYMIRDYLRGMQMAYYPPFNMFFLLITLTLLIDTGLNIKGINRLEPQQSSITHEDGNKDEAQQAEVQGEHISPTTGSSLSKEEKREQAKRKVDELVDKTTEFIDQHMSAFALICLLLFSCPLWLLFRHCPAIPDLCLSECFVAMVYISNMLSIYTILPALLCFSNKAELIYNILALLLVTIPIKQLSGYGYWGTIWRLSIASITLIFLLLLAIIASFFIMLFLW